MDAGEWHWSGYMTPGKPWEFYRLLQGLNRPYHSDTHSLSPPVVTKVSQSFELSASEC